MSEGIGREVLQLPCGQKDDVGEASERLKSSSPDEGGLDLAIDVLGDGIAGSHSVGGKNSNLDGVFKLPSAPNTLPSPSTPPSSPCRQKPDQRSRVIPASA